MKSIKLFLIALLVVGLLLVGCKPTPPADVPSAEEDTEEDSEMKEEAPEESEKEEEVEGKPEADETVEVPEQELTLDIEEGTCPDLSSLQKRINCREAYDCTYTIINTDKGLSLAQIGAGFAVRPLLQKLDDIQLTNSAKTCKVGDSAKDEDPEKLYCKGLAFDTRGENNEDVENSLTIILDKDGNVLGGICKERKPLE